VKSLRLCLCVAASHRESFYIFYRNNCSRFWCGHDYTSLLTLLNLFVAEKSPTNTVQLQMYSGDFNWIFITLCPFIYDSWKASFQNLMCSFSFSLCKVVSLLGRLRVARNIHIGCVIHTKAEEVAWSCLHATCVWNLWIIWRPCVVWLLGLQFVNTVQNDFTSRVWLLIQQLTPTPWA